MVGDNNLSPSADVTGIKFGNILPIDVHFDGEGKPTGRDLWAVRLISGVRRAIDPVRYEERQADALSVRVQACASACKRAQDDFGFTPQQAALFVLGLSASPSQADNVFSVIDKIAGLPDGEGDRQLRDEPEIGDSSASADFIGKALDEIRNVSDEEMQSYWARIIKGEYDSPGTFSKHTLTILSDMTRKDAEAFNKLCGMSIGGRLATGEFQLPEFPKIGGSPFSLTNDECIRLNALGLANFPVGGIELTHQVPLAQPLFLAVNGVTYSFHSTCGASLAIVSNVFTGYGKEMSRLCPIGALPGFADRFIAEACKSNMTVLRLGDKSDGLGGLPIERVIRAENGTAVTE